MAEIIPAILEKSFNGVTEKLERVLGVTRTVQLDICDGVFVPSLTWPYTAPMFAEEPLHYDDYFKQIVSGEGEVDMPYWEDFDFELDLMIADAKRLLPNLLTIGPSRIIFHAEAFSDLHSQMHELIRMVPPIIEIGVAINPDTKPEILFPILDEKIVSFVQCMGISKIGYQGQNFDERVYENLKILRAKYPELPLAVDGSVKQDFAKKLVEAGATRLVSGSAIFSAEKIADRIAEFERVIQ